VPIVKKDRVRQPARPAPARAAPARATRPVWCGAAADTLPLTIPNQLGVDYNAHVTEGLLMHVAPELGWR
jgi:hypothetical protein